MEVSSRTFFAMSADAERDGVADGDAAIAEVTAGTGVAVRVGDSGFAMGADWVQPAQTRRATRTSPGMKRDLFGDIR